MGTGGWQAAPRHRMSLIVGGCRGVLGVSLGQIHTSWAAEPWTLLRPVISGLQLVPLDLSTALTYHRLLSLQKTRTILTHKAPHREPPTPNLPPVISGRRLLSCYL